MTSEDSVSVVIISARQYQQFQELLRQMAEALNLITSMPEMTY